MDTRSFFRQLEKRYSDISGLITAAEKKISKLPSGMLRIKRTKNYSYYCYSKDPGAPEEKYLSPSDSTLIDGLIQKSYLQKVVKAAQDEQAVLRKALDHYPEILPEEVYITLPKERQDHIKPIVTTDDEAVREWASRPFTPKPLDENIPYYVTLKGERVRSKSEQIIADRLFARGIPYKYDCPLKVGKETYFPDFTILRVSDRQEIYYEHRGMVDDPGYITRNMKKYRDYSLNGIHIGEKLYISEETKEFPLDMRVIDEMIEKFFR